MNVTGPGTPAQKSARARNWKIFNLRSLYPRSYCLSPQRREAMRLLIDAELKDLGAKTEAEKRAEWEADMAAEEAKEDQLEEMPF